MIQNFQIALFTATINLTNKVELVNRINKELKDLFNGEPLIMPIPDNAPLEIPRIILNSKDQDFSLNISPTRVDLIFNNKKQAVIEFKELSNQMKKYISLLAKILEDEFSSSFIRMGVVSVTKIETDKPLDSLYSYLDLSKVEIKNKKELQLHLYEKEKGEGINYNNWIRLIAQDYDPNRPGLVMVNDINSINTDGKVMNLEQILQVFEDILTRMGKNIIAYA